MATSTSVRETKWLITWARSTFCDVEWLQIPLIRGMDIGGDIHLGSRYKVAYSLGAEHVLRRRLASNTIPKGDGHRWRHPLRFETQSGLFLRHGAHFAT